MSAAAPTIKDVAALAGVSPATVSNVVNGTGRAGAEARRKVQEAVEALNYRVNGNAASLRGRRSRLVGMVVPAITNAFFAELVHELEARAVTDGYDIALVSSDEDPQRERERILTLLSRQLDGLIVLPACDDSLGAGLEAAALPPTVVLDRGLGLKEFDTLGIDNEAGGHAAARHLIELGHAGIAVLVSSLGRANIRERVHGTQRALAEAGLAGRARILVGGDTVDGLRAVLEQELRREDRATAVFATSNVATLGAIKAIHGLELTMPRDVSLLGFDDYEWMTALRPYVSAVAQPVAALAERAWALLMQRSQHARRRCEHVRLAGELRIRESTGRAPRSLPAGKAGARRKTKETR